jgi:Fur family peroxide stress response transcriptional regulator
MQQNDADGSAARRLREAGLKVTPQRLAVYAALSGRRDHPTVREILTAVRRGMPTVSADTVYRTLVTLSGAGLCAALDGLGDARRFDPVTAAHHHFYCSGCGRVFDIDYPAFDRLSLPRVLGEGWTVENISVRFTGLCPACRRKKPRV